MKCRWRNTGVGSERKNSRNWEGAERLEKSRKDTEKRAKLMREINTEGKKGGKIHHRNMKTHRQTYNETKMTGEVKPEHNSFYLCDKFYHM